MLDAYILIQTHVSKAATVTAMVATVPGISEVASLAGPYDVIARAQSQDMDHLAELVTSRIQPLDGVARTMSCAVVRL